MRKRSSLKALRNFAVYLFIAYTKKKQLQIIPICTIPRSPAAQAKGLMTRQHPISSRLVGRTRMLAMAHVPELVPSRRK